MIQITLQFTSLSDALRALREIPESALAGSAVLPEPVAAVEAPEPPKPQAPAAEPAAPRAKRSSPRAAPAPVEAPVPAAAAEAAKPTQIPPNQATAAPTSATTESKSDTAPALSYEDIKVPFLQRLVPERGRDAARDLLDEFGVPPGGKLSDIPPYRWGEVLASINRRMGADA
jgi:hypothetical protein